jgi:hypothetical protein
MAENVQQPTNGNVSQNLVSGLSTPMVNSMDAIQQEIATTNRLLNIIIGRGLGGDGQNSQQASAAWAGSGPTAGITMSNNLPSAPVNNPNAGQTTAPQGPGGGTTTPSGGGGGGGKKKKKSGSSGGSDGTYEGTMRQLPIIKWGYAAADEVVSQRNKNMQYQSVEGGSNFAGFGERIKEEQAVIGTMGMFSSGEARAAYKGVTSLGYNERSKNAPGQNRQEAMDFLYKGKSQYGQSIDEGLQALQVASRSADISFVKLAQSLGEVADTAGKAGVNAKVAREQFISAMDAAVSTGYGAGSVTASKIATQTATSYGRGYAQSVDLNGKFSRSQRYLTASQFGLSQPQAVQMQRNQPAQWARLQSVKDQTVINTSFGPAFKSAIQKKIKQYGGKKAIKGNDALAANIGFEAAAETGENTDAVQDVASNLSGIQFQTPDAAMAWIVNNLGGNTEGAQAIEEQKSGAVYDSKTGLITEGEFKGQKSTAKITVDGKQTEVGTGVGLSSAFMGGKTLEPNNKGDDTWRGKQGRKWGIFGHDKGGEANAAYDKNYTDKGKENPTLKALLNNLRQRDLDPEKLHVDVGGKVYTLAEAIDKFPELLSTGKIRFLDGGIEGETTGNVAGSTIAMDSKAESKALADAGKGTGVSGTYTTSEWQEKHGQDYTGDKDKKEGGGGTLELTPAAKKLVYLLDGTGANSPPAS